jgi:cytochrome c oxidase subunit 2
LSAIPAFILFNLILFSPLSAIAADWGLNMPEGVTQVSREIYDLHMTIFWICVAIGAVVFGVMFFAMIVHQKTPDRVPATFHENTLVEIIWTVIPFVILIAMAVPATATLKKIYDTSESDIDILITAYQWKWKYEYLDKTGGENVVFFSNLSTPKDQISGTEQKNENYLLEVDQPLVIPTHKKVRFLVTAADVIHSWWVPDFAVKRDAIPGFINEAWTRVEKEGVYRGQCTELCGKDHGFMPVVVHAVNELEYQQWISAKQQQASELKALMEQHFTLQQLYDRGKTVYEKNCAACHMADGAGMAGAFPALKNSAIALGDIEQHVSMVLKGKPGTAMAAFGAQLSELDIAAVVTYERNAWGNNMGDKIQPLDIYHLKNNKD